jgi:hypothetical protein
MPGRSCTTNLLTFLEKATAAKDSGKPMDTIYLGFCKAFDKVLHKRLEKNGGQENKHGSSVLDWRLAGW